MVAAGSNPTYMNRVRNYFERIGNGSLTEPGDVFDTIETVLGRQATSLGQFLDTHGETFHDADTDAGHRTPSLTAGETQ